MINISPMDEFTARRTQKLLQVGLDYVAAGEIGKGRDSFKASAEIVASAEALTYWGWMEHHLGHTELAIDLCKRAINHDPEFGNPYNDIGSYLVSQGKLDEAIPWLERATVATRYEPRQFPHINLGRIYLAKGMPLRALSELKKAQSLSPNDESILKMISEIRRTLN